MMECAKRVQKINPSTTLAITAKAKRLKAEGKEVINFGAGEPDFDTPDYIKEKAIQAIKSGFTKYTPTTGIPELKNCICQKLKKDNQLQYSPEQIIVSCGAKHSIFNTLLSLVNPKDEVIIPNPFWVSYPEMVSICEAKTRLIETKPENKFKIEADELKKAINSKTKLLILNTPSNPCGSVYLRKDLEEIAKVCVSKKIFVVSDEIYEKIIYDNLKHTSIASLGEDIYNLTITINGLSKSYSMTGWRIGYLAAPKELVEIIRKIQDHSTSNPTSISQKAAVAAISSGDDFSVKMCAEFQKRRDYIISRLDKIKKLSYINPEGAFYIFCDISKTGIKSLDFSKHLLEEKLVAVIPGLSFGRDDYIRISFAASLSQIEEGMDRLEEWLRH